MRQSLLKPGVELGRVFTTVKHTYRIVVAHTGEKRRCRSLRAECRAGCRTRSSTPACAGRRWRAAGKSGGCCWCKGPWGGRASIGSCWDVWHRLEVRRPLGHDLSDKAILSFVDSTSWRLPIIVWPDSSGWKSVALGDKTIITVKHPF